MAELQLQAPISDEKESTLLGIPGDEIAGVWSRIVEFLQKPLIRMEMTKDFDVSDLYREITEQNMQCWLVIREDRIIGVCLTQILIYPRRKVLGIPFLGMEPHSIHQWLGHLEVLKSFARYHGCSAIRGWGRKGWVKILKPDIVRVEFDLGV